MTSADHDRVGRLLVAVRHRAGLTQAELAAAAAVPRRDVYLVETGRAGSVKLARIESMFVAAGGRARLTTWWNGAAADRLLDEQHARIVEAVVRVFERRRWRHDVEVSFSQFGERGSIDVLGAYPAARAIAVCEVKSDLGSLEETNRRLDVKARLGAHIAVERFGWRPAIVTRLLILPERDALRRLVDAHAETMRSVYPARSREVRAWLRNPDRAISGLWFVSIARDASRESRGE